MSDLQNPSRRQAIRYLIIGAVAAVCSLWKAWAGNAPAASLGSEQKTSIKLGPSAVLYRDVPAIDMRRRA